MEVKPEWTERASHPELATIYRAEVTALASALEELESRQALRGLVAAIVLTPDQAPATLADGIEVCTAMLGAIVQTKRSPETGDLSLQVVLVAGAGFEPATFGL